jgi:acyltransferase
MHRDEILDICRGIGILTVIMGHIAFNYLQLNLIYLFHMPLFFFCSGVTHTHLTQATRIQSGLYLLLSYLTYGVLFSFLGAYSKGKGIQEYLLILVTATPDSIWEIPYFGIFWFILSLMLIKLLCASDLVFKKWYLGVFLFILVAATSNQFINYNNVPLCVGPALLGLVFFQGGRYYPFIINKIRSTILLSFFSSTGGYLIVALACTLLLGGLSEKLINLGSSKVFSPILGLIVSFLGILFVLSSSVIVSSYFDWLSKLLRFLGKFSFIIFAIHPIIIAFLTATFASNINPVATKIFILLSTIGICAAIAYLVKISQISSRKSTFRKVLFMQ